MNNREIKKEFKNPSVLYRGKPFWSWNGELRSEELVRQAGVMKEMGLGGYFMHSRSGLITEYLSDEWFDLINDVADAAEKDGMEAWLYDEDRWPSGSAGGMVTKDKSLRMKSLYVFESDLEKYQDRENTVAIFIAKLSGINLSFYKEIDANTPDIKSELEKVIEANKEDAGKGNWKVLHFAIVPDKENSNYNGTTYIDTMSYKAVEKFIELTHEKYKEKCGDRLGRSIKGIFTDEPHRGKLFDSPKNENGVFTCGICYTDDIFEEFSKRYGFDAKAVLPELFYRYKGEKVSQVKLFYIDLANNLFIERFANPINEWCINNGIEFTGHVLHEDSLMNQTVPNGSLMRFYEHMGYPGIDALTEHSKNYFIVKQLTSAARQLGKKWLLSELYGCTGWQFDFKRHKAVGDWQALFGINLRCPHLSWYTMEGQSKRDYPASILHQSPWYKYYSKVEDYFSRFNLMMSEGEADCEVLLLNPIETIWCQAYVGWAKWIFNNSEDIAPFEERYAEISRMLIGNHIDYDYGEEEMMSRMASCEVNENGEAVLKVGKASYKTVIVTNMLTIRPTTLKLLNEFAAIGGRVIFSGFLPSYVNAVKSEEIKQLAEKCIQIPYSEKELIKAIKDTSNTFVSVENAEGNTEKDVFLSVRKNFGGKGYAVALINEDRDLPRNNLTLKIKAENNLYPELWDMESGKRYKYKAETDGGVYSFNFSLEPAGSICFVLNGECENLPEYKSFKNIKTEELKGDFDYIKNEPNVCVLDYIKWSFGGENETEAEEVLKADNHIRDKAGIERRGGEMLQPWFSKLNDTQKYGKLHLSYEFYVEKIPEGEIFLAGERPEFNEYKINGIKLHSKDLNDFWVDECFKKMYIPKYALKLGLNEVTIDVDFMRTTNVEAIYLAGDFGVRLEGVNTKIITSYPKKIGCEDYIRYNLPFYTGEVSYIITYDMYKDLLGCEFKNADRIMLTPKGFTGGCAKVEAMGETSILGWEPYEADVTEAVRNKAEIKLTVVGTRRNVFGPLHQIPEIAGAYGPGNFVTEGEEWTDAYSLISSGLRGIIFKAQKKEE